MLLAATTIELLWKVTVPTQVHSATQILFLTKYPQHDHHFQNAIRKQLLKGSIYYVGWCIFHAKILMAYGWRLQRTYQTNSGLDYRFHLLTTPSKLPRSLNLYVSIYTLIANWVRGCYFMEMVHHLLLLLLLLLHLYSVLFTPLWFFIVCNVLIHLLYCCCG